MMWLLACATPAPPAPAPPASTPAASTGPDLVVLLVPGLGADLGGTAGPEAALLGALGSPTVRFSAAYAQSPAPFVSLGTLLTGRYASAVPMCGLYDDGTHPTDTTERAWCAAIPPERDTLPEVLGLYGYHTALFTSGLHGGAALGGEFQAFEDVSAVWPHREAPWDELQRVVYTWWTATAGPHLLVVALPELMPTCRPDLLAATGLTPGVLDGPGDPAQAAAALTTTAGTVGKHLAELLASLPTERPRWVAVSSTNGLSVAADTGLMGGNRVPALSNNFVLERTVHVPLALYGPAPTRTVDQVVELVDVFPTLARLAGAEPPAGLPGEDMLAIQAPDVDATAYAEFGEFLAVRQGPLLLSFRSYQHHPTALDPQITQQLLAARDPEHSFRLHDVVADPWQVTDLIASRSGRYAELRALLTSIRTGVAAPPAGSLDARRLWELRMSPSQGYW